MSISAVQRLRLECQHMGWIRGATEGSSAVVWLYTYRRFNHAFHLENLPLKEIKVASEKKPWVDVWMFEGFLKWWISPTNPWVFLLKMTILGCFGGTTSLGNTLMNGCWDGEKNEMWRIGQWMGPQKPCRFMGFLSCWTVAHKIWKLQRQDSWNDIFHGPYVIINHNVITSSTKGSEKVQCFLPRENAGQASSSLEKRLTVKKEYVQPVTWLERADCENCEDVLLVTTPLNEEWIRNVS